MKKMSGFTPDIFLSCTQAGVKTVLNRQTPSLKTYEKIRRYLPAQGAKKKISGHP